MLAIRLPTKPKGIPDLGIPLGRVYPREEGPAPPAAKLAGGNCHHVPLRIQRLTNQAMWWIFRKLRVRGSASRQA